MKEWQSTDPEMEFSELEPREVLNKRNNYILNLETKFSLLDLIFARSNFIFILLLVRRTHLNKVL